MIDDASLIFLTRAKDVCRLIRICALHVGLSRRVRDISVLEHLAMAMVPLVLT
jgi:hypothetical protein